MTTDTNRPTDYPLADRYDNLVRSNPRSEAFYRNVQKHNFYLWTASRSWIVRIASRRSSSARH